MGFPAFLLCVRHRSVHEGGFSVQMNAYAQPQFRDPNGKTLPNAPEIRYRGNVFALINQNRRNGVDVTAETCIPNWGGERMDGDMVVGALFDLES